MFIVFTKLNFRDVRIFAQSDSILLLGAGCLSSLRRLGADDPYRIRAEREFELVYTPKQAKHADIPHIPPHPLFFA